MNYYDHYAQTKQTATEFCLFETSLWIVMSKLSIVANYAHIILALTPSADHTFYKGATTVIRLVPFILSSLQPQKYVKHR